MTPAEFERASDKFTALLVGATIFILGVASVVAFVG